MTLYTIIKLIHVLSAVTAIGASTTYIVWFTRAGKEPASLPFVLRTVKAIDDWIANPAYVLLFPSGWLLASLAGWSLTRPWILVSLVLYAALSVIGLGIYSPTLKKLIALVETSGMGSTEYRMVTTRLNITGITLNLLAFMILLFMVSKPALWG